MRPVKNAKRIALYSHSMWAFYLGALCFNASDAIYLSTGVDTDPAMWSMIGNVLFLYGIVGRLVDQGITRSPAAVMAVALFMAMAQVPDATKSTANYAANYDTQDFLAVAVPLIRKWEGAHRCDDRPNLHCSYLDTIADPPVWTACHGETRGITRGMRFTDKQCAKMLAKRVVEFRKGWRAYVEPGAPLHAPREAAFVSLAYNVGEAGAGRSTATRRLNAGRVPGACEALTWWNRAGDRVVRGLVRRRADEHRLCMIGVA